MHAYLVGYRGVQRRQRVVEDVAGGRWGGATRPDEFQGRKEGEGGKGYMGAWGHGVVARTPREAGRGGRQGVQGGHGGMGLWLRCCGSGGEGLHSYQAGREGKGGGGMWPDSGGGQAQLHEHVRVSVHRSGHAHTLLLPPRQRRAAWWAHTGHGPKSHGHRGVGAHAWTPGRAWKGWATSLRPLRARMHRHVHTHTRARTGHIHTRARTEA
jgi:hypothetical protein